jgi:GR25 family glycosyltransferase involved in LPS biosynthesis
METINSYFQRTYIINLRRRADRRAVAFTELAASGIDPFQLEWVEGCDNPENGHAGCSKSHRDLIRRIANGPYERVLVLEDDFKVLTLQDLVENGFAAYSPSPVLDTFKSVLNGKGNLNERFSYLIPFLPESWDVLYLQAGYGEPPISRFNKHVLRVGFMQTTGAYGITRDFAKRWTQIVDERNGDNHPGPIDNLFGSMSHDHLYYCLQPRLAFQRQSPSDITGENNSYICSGTDPIHENML